MFFYVRRLIMSQRAIAYFRSIGVQIDTSYKRTYDPVSGRYLIGCPEADHVLTNGGTPAEMQEAAYHAFMCIDPFCIFCIPHKENLKVLLEQSKPKKNS